MTKRVSVYFFDDEFDVLLNQAALADVRLGPFCRHLLQDTVVVPAENVLLWKKLANNWSNFAQIEAHLAATQRPFEKPLVELLEEAKRVLSAVSDALIGLEPEVEAVVGVEIEPESTIKTETAHGFATGNEGLS